jgi:hypothetical protein
MACKVKVALVSKTEVSYLRQWSTTEASGVTVSSADVATKPCDTNLSYFNQTISVKY